MTNNNQEKCICNHGDVENKCYPITRCACKVHGKFSQPSSVPVEKEIPHAHCRCMNIGNTCSNRHYADCDICKPITSPSTPEVSWESEFEENIPKNVGEPTTFGEKYEVVSPQRYNSIWTVTDWGKIKSFIKSVEQKSYERGKRYGHDLGINYADTIPSEETTERITLTERKRVNDILDGMKKEGDDFQCFNTDCFGNRTPTVIEKRLSSEDNSYNQALIDLKHLINNTQ